MTWFISSVPTKPLVNYLDETYPGLHITGPYKEHKITVLAERTGVDRRTISRWFAGQGQLRLETADRFCEGLGIHPTKIWGEEW